MLWQYRSKSCLCIDCNENLGTHFEANGCRCKFSKFKC